MSRAYAAQGAVIISDDGRQVRYHPQCPHCGKVNEGTTSNAAVGSGIRASLGIFNCFSCGKSFEVKINRDC